MEKIFYIISVLILFLLFMIVKRKDEKKDFLITLAINVFIFLSYNTLTCIIYNFLKIKVTLSVLMIPNYIISLIFLYKLIKVKKIQGYYIHIKDIVAILIIISVCLGVSYLNFGFPFNISFICNDASSHYEMAYSYYIHGAIGNSQCAAYTNYGIVFMIFSNMIREYNGYIIFILLEIIKLAFSGILFYLVVKKYAKTKIAYVLSILLSVIYMIAYPLNGVISGFVYLQLAVNFVNAILLLMENETQISKLEKNISLMFLTTGVMFSYYILVPPIYIAIFLYELKNIKRDKFKILIDLLIIFLIPCVLGIIIHIVPILTKVDTSAISVMGIEEGAYIFVNYYSGLLFFMIFGIIYLINIIKDKKWNLLLISLITTILYIVLLLILREKGIIGRYYCMKIYYMLWLIIAAITSITISEILNKKIDWFYKMITIISISMYIIGIVICILTQKARLKVFDREKETISSMFNIYTLNKSTILHENSTVNLTNQSIKIIQDVCKEMKDGDNLIFVGEWIRAQCVSLIFYERSYFYRGDNVIEDLVKNEKLDEMIENENVYIIYYNSEWSKYYKKDTLEFLKGKLSVYKENSDVIVFYNK